MINYLGAYVIHTPFLIEWVISGYNYLKFIHFVMGLFQVSLDINLASGGNLGQYFSS